MPITCHTQKVSKTSVTHVNFLEHVMQPVNIKVLRACVCESITSIEANVFDSEVTTKSSTMRATAARADHIVLLALFMLLARLKDRVVLSAQDENKHKVVRLMQDLRSCLVLDYFTNEEHTTNVFVYACEDTYIL